MSKTHAMFSALVIVFCGCVQVTAQVPAVTSSQSGFRLDLQYGQATETVQGNAASEPRPQVYRNLWQAFGAYVFEPFFLTEQPGVLKKEQNTATLGLVWWFGRKQGTW